MKKRLLAVACIIALILGLFLVGCQKKEEPATEAGGYGEQAPGYGEEKAPGYGEQKAPGYGEEKAPGYGEEKAKETGSH